MATTATIRGYTVVVSARPYSYHWDMGNGDSRDGSISGVDAEQGASVTYTYQRKNADGYTVTLTVMWKGQYTFAGNGVGAQTQPLNAVAQNPPMRQRFSVEEVVPVGVDPSQSAATPRTLPDRSHC